MQPSANIKPRAELHQSAPSAVTRAMSKALMTLPADLGAERPFVQSALGALVDDGALVAREGSTIFRAFEKILTNLGANLFENKADMCRQRIVAQDGVPGL